MFVGVLGSPQGPSNSIVYPFGAQTPTNLLRTCYNGTWTLWDLSLNPKPIGGPLRPRPAPHFSATSHSLGQATQNVRRGVVERCLYKDLEFKAKDFRALFQVCLLIGLYYMAFVLRCFYTLRLSPGPSAAIAGLSITHSKVEVVEGSCYCSWTESCSTHDKKHN